MIINMESLARLYTGFTAVFNAAFQVTQTWYVRVAMTVPANTRIMDYKFLLDFPMVREWIGDRQISSLEPKDFQVETKDWEATIEVDRNDIEDDQLGFYNPIVAALAQEAHADYVVVHDSENNSNHKYRLTTVHHLYKYRWKYDDANPKTNIFSNKFDVRNFKV